MVNRALDVCSTLHNELHLVEHAAYHSSGVPPQLNSNENVYRPSLTWSFLCKPLAMKISSPNIFICGGTWKTLCATGHTAVSYVRCYNPCEWQRRSNELMQAAHSVHVPVCVLWLTVDVLSIY